MYRRQLLRASLAVSTATILPRAAGGEPKPADVQFGPSYVRDLARSIASKPFEPPDEKLPNGLKDLNYDQYRSIRFLPERALWRGEKLPFEAQFFHRGFFYKNKVDLYEVTNERAPNQISTR